MRLIAMIPYVIIMYIGNIVAAIGMERKWPWQVIVVVAFGAAGIQVASIPSIVSTYAVDSYKPVAGPLFVAVTVNKNVWGYGFSKFITPWVEEAGFIPPIMTNGSLVLLWCLFGILFYYKGKTFRRWLVFPSPNFFPCRSVSLTRAAQLGLATLPCTRCRTKGYL